MRFRIAEVKPVDLNEPTLLRLLAYWQERRADRVVPLWSAIDPVEIPWALRYIWVCDFEPTTQRFLYRLSGEDISDVFGVNLRGRYLDEFFTPDGRAVVYQRYLAAIQTPAIVTVRGLIYLRCNRLLEGERLMLPMSRNGEAIDMLLGATVCTDAEESARRPYLDATQQEQETTIIPLREDASAVA